MDAECASLSTEFLPALDWRPLHFQHPLPHGRVCQLCGIVSKETVQLSCFHTLCNVCYEGSVDLGCVCPLDREVFSQEGLDKLRLQPEHLLKLKVFCWNSVHGCNFVGPASDLLDHFAKDCVYHKVPCPKCNQNVPRLGLVRHYVNECDRGAEPLQPDVTYRGKLNQELEKVSAALTQSIAELKDGYYRLQTSLNTVADDVRLGLSEGKQATEGASALLRELQRTQSDVNSQSCKLLEDLKRAGVEIKQSIARRNGSGQGASAATGCGDCVQPEHSQRYVSEEVILDTNMSLEMQFFAVHAFNMAMADPTSKNGIAAYIAEMFTEKYQRGCQCVVRHSPVSYAYCWDNLYIYFRKYDMYIVLTG